MPYDPVRDFAPIGQVGVTPTLLAVHPSVTATDVKSLVAVIKKNPGKLTYGSSGLGSILFICAARNSERWQVSLTSCMCLIAAPRQ